MQFSSQFSKFNSLNTSGFKTSNFKATKKNVNFNNAMNSVNLSMFNFTNFFYKKSPLVKAFKKEYGGLKNGSIDIDDNNKYAATIVNYSDRALELKIKTIIEKTRNVRVNQLPLMYKYKNKQNPELQFYVANNTNNEYEVLAIDLYHLLIPAPDKSRHETTEHSKEKYEQYKLADYNLSELSR